MAVITVVSELRRTDGWVNLDTLTNGDPKLRDIVDTLYYAGVIRSREREEGLQVVDGKLVGYGSILEYQWKK